MLRLLRLQATRRYCVVGAEAGGDRDPRMYLRSSEDLVFLRSPRTLLFKAETAVELCSEVAAALETNAFSNPVRALSMIDSISCLLCMSLDASEVVRSIHPREEFKGQAIQAFDYTDKYMASLNTDRSLYKHVVRLTDTDIWDGLEADQKYYVSMLKQEMESVGLSLPPAKAKLAAALLSDKERKVNEILGAQESTIVQDPEAQIGDLIEVRHELAETMGYDSYITWSMVNTLADDPIEVWKVLLSLADSLQDSAREEVSQLSDFKKKVTNANLTPDREDYDITDFEKRDLFSVIRNRDFKGVEDEVKQYLSVANVWKGLELMISELFGLTMEKADMRLHEKYDKNLQKFEIYTIPRKESESRKLVGTLYADMFKREGKPVGSGHYTVQVGSEFDEFVAGDLDIVLPTNNKLSPIVIFSCDCEGAFAELDPRMHIEEKRKVLHDWNTVLLAAHEVVTVFHEFGHCIHSLLGQTRYQSLSGTRSTSDYVEIFSQITEIYARDYRSLRRWATHHETGLPIPKELCDRMLDLEASFGSLTQLDEIVNALVDLTYHGPRPLKYFTLDPNDKENILSVEVPEGFDRPLKLRQLIGDSLTPIRITELGVRRNFVDQHLVTYPGTYYSYTFSRIYASAIWKKYFETDPFSREAGEKLKSIMARGGSAPPKQLVGMLLPGMSTIDVLKAASA